MGNLSRLVIFVLFVRLIFALLPHLFSIADPTNDYSLNRWDAPHYLWIAKYGYTDVGDERNFIVFQPLYPYAIRLLSAIGLELQTAATLISIISFVAGSMVFYKLLRLDYSHQIATIATILLSLFPTSYFFSAPYTESLFFALCVTSLYQARKHNWLWAGVAAGFAVLTRHIGILLIIPLFVEWYQTKKRRLLHPFFFAIPILIAGLMYLSINYAIYSDPFAFQKILHEHWQKSFVPFWQSLAGTWNIALGGNDRYSLEVGWWEAIPATLSLLLIPFMFKYLRKSYALYYTSYVLFITSTNFLLSTARYLVSIPPLFVLLAIASNKSKLFFIVWSTISVGLLMYFSKQFVSGGWGF